MSYSQFSAIIAAVELGNLSRAAQSLGYTQSGITQLIDKLESDCGYKLIVREKKGAYLTAEGQQLMPYFREIKSSYDSLYRQVSDMQRLETGLIRIGSFNTISVMCLPKILREFRERYPGIRIEPRDGTTEELRTWLLNGDIDLTFDCPSPDYPLPYYDLGFEEMLAIMPIGHPLEKRKRVTADDLMSYPFIKLNEGNINQVPEISEIFDEYHITPDVAYSESNDFAVINMVQHGLGISVLPQMILNDVKDKVSVRPLAFPARRHIVLAVKNKNLLTQSILNFADFTREWMSRIMSD